MVTRDRFALVSSLLLGTALVGCSEPSNKPVQTVSPTGTKPNAPAATPVAPATADHSLTTEQYIELGMPSPDRTWSSIDMAAAAKVLEDISQREPSRIPRYASPKSGEMFARLTSAENVAALQNKQLPINVRLPETLNFFQAANVVNKAYLTTLISKTTSEEEAAEITGLLLRLAVVMIASTDEFAPTLDPQDPTYPTRMDGMKRMKSGLGTMLQGAIQQVSEPNTWSLDPLGRFIGYMDETFPIIIQTVTPNVRQETLRKLKRQNADPGLRQHQPAFQQMLAKVAAAANRDEDQQQK